MTTIETKIGTPEHYIKEEVRHMQGLYTNYCLDVHQVPSRSWWVTEIYQKNGHDKMFKRLYECVYGSVHEA